MESKMIYKKMASVMVAVSAISKARKNQTQNYNFRGIDDVYNELHDIMAENSIVCLPEILSERSEERTSKNGGCLIYRVIHMRFTFITEDGSSVSCSVIGEGMDNGDKATNKAMSVAQKYALIQTFLIPTEEAKDPENDSHDLLPDSKRVGLSVHNLIQKVNENKIPIDLFTGFLISRKTLTQHQKINDLSDDKAKGMLDNWQMVLDLLGKYADSNK